MKLYSTREEGTDGTGGTIHRPQIPQGARLQTLYGAPTTQQHKTKKRK